ncbi:IclR family mhp operon transcriptional activator [Sphingomonas zeicaulis]|uniref:IclR family transcriptional regulator domain-containing protein n=1 Tax=Sphingomonas zeicaulis TaxID=1632740 RepID=UPI003D212475
MNLSKIALDGGTKPHFMRARRPQKSHPAVMEKGVPIRSLARGISVLQAVNRGGSLSMMEIARASNVPYPTACRIVQTLLFEGLIEQEPVRKRYRPTGLVQTLAHGFQGHAAVVQTARPHIVELTRRVMWPISLSTHVGSNMVIRDSTHSLTTLTFNDYYPGYSIPILECASGLVYLAHMPEEEREGVLASLKRLPDRVPVHTLRLIEEETLLEDVRRQGYATRGNNHFTRNPGKTSSIAVPIFEHGRVAATLTLAFFSSAVRMDDAIKQFVEPLRETGLAITAELAPQIAAAE